MLKADAEKEADELPFGPPQADQRQNVFGDKKNKDAILKRMEYQVGFIAEGAGFNNTDLRRLDEATTASIQNTDDKQTLAFSRFYLNLYFPITDDLNFRVDFFKNGFWGHDQLAGASSNNNSASTQTGVDPINFGELNLGYIVWKNQHSEFSLKIGRQFFEIGGEVYDYFLKDYLDAITLSYANPDLGSFRIMPIEALQLGADPTLHANYVRFFSHDTQRIQFFDGDVNVLRAGFVYDSQNLLHWRGSMTADLLQNKLYAFGARYGATGKGGADRAAPGTPGNFADNDFNMMFGTRFLLSLPRENHTLKAFADAAMSTGVDRQLPTAAGESEDINTNGFAFAAGATFELLKLFPVLDLDFSSDGFYASGARYDANGTQTSHGFTSFKGSRVGGVVMSKFYGVRPSSFTDSAGFSDTPHDYERKAPTGFLHFGLGVTLWKKIRFGFDYWIAYDTSKSDLVSDARANGTMAAITGTLPRSQERFGKPLGEELDCTLDFAVNQYWSLYLRSGIFFPGAFYATPGLVTATPYGTDNAMGIQLGSKLVF